jgi:hypothetical protein
VAGEDVVLEVLGGVSLGWGLLGELKEVVEGRRMDGEGAAEWGRGGGAVEGKGGCVVALWMGRSRWEWREGGKETDVETMGALRWGGGKHGGHNEARSREYCKSMG